MKSRFTALFLALCLAPFLATVAPVARANSYLYTYSFTGACYFGGTSVSFTTNGPALLNTDYTPNPGASDLYTGGSVFTCPTPTLYNEGPIEDLYFAKSPYAFSPCTSVCTLQLYIVTKLDSLSGPTLAGLAIPGPGTYTEYFDHGTLTVTARSVPEPATLSLLTLGLAGMGLLRRSRRR